MRLRILGLIIGMMLNACIPALTGDGDDNASVLTLLERFATQRSCPEGCQPITTPAPEILPTITLTTTSNPECAYTWDVMYLEDDSVALMDDLRKAGLSQVDAWVEAYGEVCIEYQSKTTSGFTIVQTNYKMIVPFDEVTDEETLGFLLDDILSVLENHQAAQTPGLNPGMVWIKFEMPSEEINLSFKLMDALEERSRGLTGVSMINKYQQ